MGELTMRFSKVMDFVVRDENIRIWYIDLKDGFRDFPYATIHKAKTTNVYYVEIPYDPVVDFELNLVVK